MKLRQRKIGRTLTDNAFTGISGWTRAQSIADSLRTQKLYRKLDELATRFCPIYRSLGMSYHRSVDQCEYATDIVFRKQTDFVPLDENLSRTAVRTVKPDNVATFLARSCLHSLRGR